MKITGLNKAEVLVALYNRAKTVPVTQRYYDSNLNLSLEKAAELLKQNKYFDYLNGKVLKIDLSIDEIETSLYNRDNGENAAEESLQPLIEKHKEKCTPKSLKSISAQVAIKNKNLLFSKLHTLPAELCDEFPALEVEPMKAFKRKVKKVLGGTKFEEASEEATYVKKLYEALSLSHPYNSIHPIIKEMKDKFNKGFLSTFKQKMQTIVTEITKYMNEYVTEKKEYTKTKGELTASNNNNNNTSSKNLGNSEKENGANFGSKN